MNSRLLPSFVCLQVFVLAAALCGCEPSRPTADGKEAKSASSLPADSPSMGTAGDGSDKPNTNSTATATTGSATNKAGKGNFMKRIPLIGGGNLPKATVKIPHQGQTVEVEVELKKDGPLAGVNEQAKAGVSSLQIDDYTNAVTELLVAVKAKPKNESYHFALAVAMELTGDLAGSRTNYVEANKLAGGSGSATAQAGLKRLEARGK